MVSNWKSWWLPRLGLVVVAALVPAMLFAAERTRTRSAARNQPAGEVVEMFSAMESGQLEVRLIPKDSTQSTVVIRNKTDKPLSVRLPEAFAGVPVLAQFEGGGGGMETGYGGTGGGGGGAAQGMGGGMGGMGGMGGYGGMGGGMFNVPPEKVEKLKVATVCLDHGKDEPRSNMKYVIKPIEAYSDKPAVREVCRMLGQGAVPQRVAQAAAWNLNNAMGWDKLAGKQIRHVTGLCEPYFNQAEILAAKEFAKIAVRNAEKKLEENRKANQSDSGSLNQPST